MLRQPAPALAVTCAQIMSDGTHSLAKFFNIQPRKVLTHISDDQQQNQSSITGGKYFIYFLSFKLNPRRKHEKHNWISDYQPAIFDIFQFVNLLRICKVPDPSPIIPASFQHVNILCFQAGNSICRQNFLKLQRTILSCNHTMLLSSLACYLLLLTNIFITLPYIQDHNVN